MKELAPGIVVFENIFPESMDYIAKIEQAGISWRAAEVLVNPNEHVSGTDTKARDTDLIMLPHHTDSQDSVLNEFTKEFHARMKPCLDQYMAAYYAKIEKFENPQLLRYGKEQKFHDHIDDHPFFTRRISLTYYLNDEYEGGDVEFNRHGLRFKAKKNDLLIFPSNFIYNHQVHPVTDGLRYVVVQWMA
jgi:predicted 2-oxoglutarate/Fe(II)-dependent dioxygenase YbiX